MKMILKWLGYTIVYFISCFTVWDILSVWYSGKIDNVVADHANDVFENVLK